MAKLAWATGVALLATVLAEGATAANLVTNGDFDVDVAGWTLLDSNIQVDWSPLDPADPTTSGSIRVRSVATNLASPGAIQCIDLPNDAPLAAEAAVQVPEQARDVYALFVAYFYDGDACDGILLDFLFSDPVGEQVGWTSLAWNAATPAGAESVRFYLALMKDADPAPVYVYFDRIAVPEPTHAALGAASLAAIALVRWRRR